ncbi:unnamed protein product [Meloidogyne enterolobii]|uniref:Uncharacterized protein n=1 Tax=Meloidogyne enterolobii TaxID=390850 RepID=A0ACB0ZW23_MELEN
MNFSDNFAQNELLEYIKNPKRIYTDRGSDELFLKEVGQSVVGCHGREEESLTEINTDNNLIKPAKALAGIVQKTKILELNEEENDDRFERDEEIIILDASSSRESVFEHQRELALSLIEKLPISVDDTHVAIGINSFTNVPVLRQTLGLGRERKAKKLFF